jgi:P4 family phage/plasmid primase-like protien
MKMRFCKLKGKVPFEPEWQKKGYSKDELRIWGGNIGLIIPKGFICVDIDNREDADKIKDFVISEGHECAIHETPRGLHLIYREPKQLRGVVYKNWSRKSVYLGLDLDFRVAGGQIVYPMGQEGRKVIKGFTGNEMELPEIFFPLTYALPKNYIQLQEGERDSSLTEHYGRLKRYNCDADSIIHTINGLLDDPLDYNQVAKIIDSITRKENAKQKDTESGVGNWYYDGKLVAYKLAEHIADMCEIIYFNDLWLQYNSGIWELKDEKEIAHYIRTFIKRPKMVQVNEVLNQLALLTINNKLLFNQDPELIVFSNTAYKRGELIEFSKEHYSTMRIETEYDENAAEPKFWLKFLASSIVDGTNIKTLQEMIGYFLVTNLKAKSFFILHGPTDCGKSVISDILGFLIGRSKISNTSIQAICDTSNRWAAGELYNNLVNINTDISDKVLQDTSILKQFTGDRYIRYEFKGKQPFSGPVTCRLMFVANSMPATTDHSSAFYNRLKIINFPHSIPVEDQDEDLIDKLKLEASGIINWALEGLERLICNNYRFTEDLKIKEEYKEYSNSVLLFIREYCEFNHEGEAKSSELYGLYKFFCKEDGYISFSQKKFIKEILNTGKCEKAKTAKARLIKGLRITYTPEIKI